MLTFGRANIIWFTAMILLIVTGIFYPVSWVIYAVLSVAYLLVIVYGCSFISSQFFLNVLCKGRTNRRQIAITFDDGPVPGMTSGILDILRIYSVKAAFFCIGKNIPGNEELLKRISHEGHIVGNHSDSHHVWFDLFSSQKMLNDILEMNRKVKTTLGKSPRLFRPPYGVINPNLKKAIIESGLITVGWSVRSLDTVIKNKDRLLRKVKRSLHPGAVILFHDTGKATEEILPEFINYVLKEGYEIIRLDNLLNIKAYE